MISGGSSASSDARRRRRRAAADAPAAAAASPRRSPLLSLARRRRRRRLAGRRRRRLARSPLPVHPQLVLRLSQPFVRAVHRLSNDRVRRPERRRRRQRDPQRRRCRIWSRRGPSRALEQPPAVTAPAAAARAAAGTAARRKHRRHSPARRLSRALLQRRGGVRRARQPRRPVAARPRPSSLAARRPAGGRAAVGRHAELRRPSDADESLGLRGRERLRRRHRGLWARRRPCPQVGRTYRRRRLADDDAGAPLLSMRPRPRAIWPLRSGRPANPPISTCRPSRGWRVFVGRSVAERRRGPSSA